MDSTNSSTSRRVVAAGLWLYQVCMASLRSFSEMGDLTGTSSTSSTSSSRCEGRVTCGMYHLYLFIVTAVRCQHNTTPPTTIKTHVCMYHYSRYTVVVGVGARIYQVVHCSRSSSKRTIRAHTFVPKPFCVLYSLVVKKCAKHYFSSCHATMCAVRHRMQYRWQTFLHTYQVYT